MLLELGENVTAETLEIKLREKFGRSRPDRTSIRQVTLDFSLTKEIDTYSIALIWCILSDYALGANATILLPAQRTPGNEIIYTLLNNTSLVLTSSGSYSYDQNMSCLVREIGGEVELDNFIMHANDPAQLDALFPGLMSLSESLKKQCINTFIRELVQNSLFHSSCGSCIIVGSIKRIAHSKYDSVLSYFRENAYVDLTIADNGQNNIITNLKDQYQPDISTLTFSGAVDAERILLSAFEYETTSDPILRSAALVEFFETFPDDNPGVRARDIATGLYDVLNLIAATGGQCVIRNDRYSLSIDYSLLTDNKPTIRRLPPRYRKSLLSVQGTIINLRIPVDRNVRPRIRGQNPRTTPPPASRELSLTRAQYNVFFHTIPVSHEYIFHKELFYLRETLIVEARPSKLFRILIISLDNWSSVENKKKVAALEYISMMPRNRVAVVVTTQDMDLITKVRAQNDYVVRENDAIHSYPSILLLGPGVESTNFGNTDHAHATYVHDGIVRIGRDTYCLLTELVFNIRFSIVKYWIKSGNMTLGEGPFHFPGKYYTDQFFNYQMLIRDTIARSAFEEYLIALIAKLNVNVMITISSTMRNVVLGALRKHDRFDISLYFADPKNRLGSAFEIDKRMRLHPNENYLIVVDVVNTGESIATALSHLPSVDGFLVVALCDLGTLHRPPRKGRAIAIPRTNEGDRLIPVLPVYSEQVNTTFARPANIPLRRIRTIHDIEERPEATPERSSNAIGLDEFVTRLTSTHGLHSGHISRRGRHYPYVFNFAIFCQLFGSEIIEWLSTQAQFDDVPEISKDGTFSRLKRVNDRSTIRCLVVDEQPSLYRFVEEIIAKDRIAPVLQLVSRDAFSAPVGAGFNNIGDEFEYVWVVLPASSTGDTVNQILDHFSWTKTKYLKVSILLGRSDNIRLAHYARITEYAGFRVDVNFFSFIPLPSYQKNICPMCLRHERIVGTIRSLTRDSEVLRQALHECQAALHVREIEDAPPVLSNAAQTAQIAEVRSLCEYMGLSDAKYIWAPLESSSIDPTSNLADIARAVGRTVDDISPFHKVILTFEKWSNDERAKMFDQWLFDLPARYQELKGTIALEFRGVFLLYPNIEKYIGKMFERCVGVHNLFALLCAELIMLGDRTEHLVFRPEIPETVRASRAFIELRTFLSPENSAATIQPWRILTEIRWGLTRHSGWKTNYDFMLVALRGSAADFRHALRDFERDGIEPVGRLVDNLNKFVTFIGVLEEIKCEFHRAWAELLSTAEMLRVSIADLFEFNRDQAHWYIEQIDLHRSNAVEAVDAICVQPQVVLREFRVLATDDSPFLSRFDVDISDDAKSILFDRSHFRSIIMVILENAKTYGEKTGNAVSFVFRASSKFVGQMELLVFQTAEWDESCNVDDRSEGGVRHIRSLCDKYGAHFRLRAIGDPAGLTMMFRFLSVPLDNPEWYRSVRHRKQAAE